MLEIEQIQLTTLSPVDRSLPNISAAFDAGRSSSFVAAAYLLTSTAFQPIWGRLSDVFGRKVTLIVCVVFFTIGSLACAVAQSMLQLIIFRGLQGVGGGGLLTLVLIIVSDVVTLKERGKYQGITEATIMIGNGIGLSIIVIALFLPLKQVKGSMKKKLKQIDYGGSFLTMSASVLLILPLNWGGTSFPWVSGPVLGCLIAGVVTFAIFFVWEGKIAKIPVVPPAIFKQRTVATIFYNTFCSGATILVQLYYMSVFLLFLAMGRLTCPLLVYLQVARGYSAIRSGVLILPQLVLTTFWVFVTGQLIARTGQYKPSICVGYAIWTIGLGLLSTIDQHTSDARLIGFLIINATGQGQTLQSSMVAAQAAVARSEMSVVTSTRNFCRSLGGTIFLVIASAILNNTLRSNLNRLGFASSIIDSLIDDPTGIWRVTADNGSMLFDLSATQKSQIIEAYVKGFHTLFRVFVGLIGCNCITATLLIERHSLDRKDEDALKQRGKDWVEKQKAKKKGAKGAKEAGDAEKGEVEGAQSHDTVVEQETKGSSA
ncbi:SPOSA6832_03141, partial [Sporobolomyces salmonicolor]